MLAGPRAFAIDGSLEELVDGRIDRNGDIEIRFCKPAAAGAGPNNQPNRGLFLTDHCHFTPGSGGTIPYNEDDSKKDQKDDRKPSGGGGGPGGGDDGNGNGNGGGNRDSSPPQSPHKGPKKDKRKAKRGNVGGDDVDDPDKDSDDSDEKFVRRMKKFLGGGFNTGGSDDKPKSQRSRYHQVACHSRSEVAASTNPDAAFEWIAEVWKEGQNIEALRKVAPSQH